MFKHFFVECIIYDVFVNKEKATYSKFPSIFNSLLQIIYTNISVPQLFSNIFFKFLYGIIFVVI